MLKWSTIAGMSGAKKKGLSDSPPSYFWTSSIHFVTRMSSVPT